MKLKKNYDEYARYVGNDLSKENSENIREILMK